MIVRLPPSFVAAVLSAPALFAPAASPAAGPPACDGGRGGLGHGRSGAARRRPALYRCEVEVGAEPVRKACAVVETDVICVPPITTSPLDGLRDLLTGRRGDDPGRRSDGCGANGGGRPPRAAGWFARLTRGGGGGIRCVRSLGSRDDGGGTRRTYDWSAVRVDACGRPLVPADEAPADENPAAPGGDAPPPAPAPRFDDPAEPADPGVEPKEGVAGDSVS